MNARPLLPALGQITIPETFTVTSICATESCRLRLIASSNPEIEQLIAGPKASAGALHHALVHEWAMSDSENVETFFEDRLAVWDSSLQADARTAHQAPLRATMNGIDWLGFKRKTLAAMLRARAAEKGRPVPRYMGGSKREQLWQSRALRIRGRPDLIRCPSAQTIQIRDFKSGLIWDENGGLKRSIVLQLSLYGLLLAEENPRAVIELVVDDGEPTSIPFTREDARHTRTWLAQFLSGIDAGQQVPANSLASPGSECRTCPVRHQCEAYLTIAPTWWRAIPSIENVPPADTWGIITHIESRGDLSRIKITDGALRTVQIDMLAARHGFAAVDVNRPIWLFGLATRGSGRSPDGIRYHPYNFYEMPRDARDRRAWSLQAFTDIRERS